MTRLQRMHRRLRFRVAILVWGRPEASLKGILHSPILGELLGNPQILEYKLHRPQDPLGVWQLQVFLQDLNQRDLPREWQKHLYKKIRTSVEGSPYPTLRDTLGISEAPGPFADRMRLLTYVESAWIQTIQKELKGIRETLDFWARQYGITLEVLEFPHLAPAKKPNLPGGRVRVLGDFSESEPG